MREISGSHLMHPHPHLQACPPSVFPFYGLTPAMLRAMSNPATIQARAHARGLLSRLIQPCGAHRRRSCQPILSHAVFEAGSATRMRCLNSLLRPSQLLQANVKATINATSRHQQRAEQQHQLLLNGGRPAARLGSWLWCGLVAPAAAHPCSAPPLVVGCRGHRTADRRRAHGHQPARPAAPAAAQGARRGRRGQVGAARRGLCRAPRLRVQGATAALLPSAVRPACCEAAGPCCPHTTPRLTRLLACLPHACPAAARAPARMLGRTRTATRRTVAWTSRWRPQPTSR